MLKNKPVAVLKGNKIELFTGVNLSIFVSSEDNYNCRSSKL